MASAAIELIIMLGGFVVAVFVAILVHEMGHVIAGFLFGFRIVIVRVGPIHLFLSKESRLTFGRHHFGSGEVLPQFRKLPGRWATLRTAAFILGGPLSNFAFASIGFFAALSGSKAEGILAFPMLLSLLFGLANLIPFSSHGRTSDGAKLVALAFSKSKREDLLFGYSILAHHREIKRLCRAQDLHSAHAVLTSYLENLRARVAAFDKLTLVTSLERIKDDLERGINESAAFEAKS